MDLGFTPTQTCLVAVCDSACSSCYDNGAQSCLTCSPNYYFSSGNCMPCMIGSYSLGGAVTACISKLTSLNLPTN